MGQYYHVLTEEAATKKRTYDNGPVNTGHKLTEHSWIGNYYTNYYSKLLELVPCRIAWVGDYAEDEDFDKHGIPYEGSENETQIKTPVNKNWNYMNKFLTNHTKKTYIDLSKYFEENYDNMFDTALHPLPILTAISNGKGGGDYNSHSDKELVGTWAWDILEMKQNRPEYYEEIMPHFKEE